MAAAERRRSLALSGGDPYDLRHVFSWLANIAIARGDWTHARSLLDAADPILARLETSEPKAFREVLDGIIALELGQVSTALTLVAGSLTTFRSIAPGTLAWYLGVLGVAYLADGQEGAALSVAVELEAIADSLPNPSLPGGSALGQVGLVRTVLGSEEDARRCFERLQAHSGQFHWNLIDRVLAGLARRLGDVTTANHYLDLAEASARRNRMVPETVRILDLRTVLGGKPATDLQREAADLAAAIGVPRVRVVSVPRLDRDSPRLPAGLSEREAEVLRLVVAGCGNREIAETLVLSEKTVANHLTHIFTKIGVENRAAAVAYALRAGIA